MTYRHALVILLLSLCGLGAWSGWRWRRTAGEVAAVVRPLPVAVAQIQPARSYPRCREYTGVVVARRSSDVGFEHGGKVLDIRVEEGASVAAGDVLAVLDTRELQAERDRVAAQWQEAVAGRTRLEEGPRKETIAAARADVERLEAWYRLETNNLERREQLWKTRSVALEEVDQARTSLDAAAAQLQGARHQLDELLTGTREEDLAAQRAVVAQLEAAARTIDVRLDDSVLRAPFSGTIAKRYLDEGQVVAAATPIVRVVESQHLEAQIGVPPELARQIRKGKSYAVRCGEDDFPAILRTLLPELNSQTQTQLAIFELSPMDRPPAVGAVARVTLTQHVACDGFWIPASAVQRGERGLWSVFAVRDTEAGPDLRVERTDVEVLFADAERVLALGSLAGGERVVADGLHRLVNRQLVTAVPETIDWPSPPGPVEMQVANRFGS